MPIVSCNDGPAMQAKLLIHGLSIETTYAPLSLMNVLHPIHKGERLRGKVLISDFDIADEFLEDKKACIVVSMWVTNTDSEIITFKISFEDGKVIPCVDNRVAPDKGIDVFCRDGDGGQFYFVGGIISRATQPCTTCAKKSLSPQLAFRFFRETLTSGNLFMGNAYADLSKGESRTIPLSNNPLNHYMKVAAKGRHPIHIGAISIDGIEGDFGETFSGGDSIETNQLKVFEARTEGTIEIPSYRDRSDFLVQQTHIAVDNGLIPRPYYYAIFRNFLSVSPMWLWAQLDFSFALGGIDRIGICELSTGPLVVGKLTLETWNMWMHHIIRAFTMFITRFLYSFDNYDVGDEKHPKKVNCEYYSAPYINLENRYDCEDGACWLKWILSLVQDLTDSDIESNFSGEDAKFMRAVRYMVRQYVCATALVTATSPKMEACRGGMLQTDEIYYHMTVSLIPVRYFTERVYYRGDFVKGANTLSGPFETKVPIKLDVPIQTSLPLSFLFVESTANFYSDPGRSFNSSFDKGRFNNMVDAHDDLMCIPVCCNFLPDGEKELASTYLRYISFYTDFFYKPYVHSSIHDTVFYMLDEGTGRLEVDAQRMMHLPEELKLISTCKISGEDLDKMKTKVLGVIPKTYLLMDKAVYLNEKEKCAPHFPIGPFDGWFERCDAGAVGAVSKNRIPYASWWATNKSEAQMDQGSIYVICSSDSIAKY